MSSIGTTKHILVTGGSGFIGRALCRSLISLGHQLTVLTRDPKITAAMFDNEGAGTGITFIESAVDMNGRRCDAVINLAGESLAKRWSPASKNEFRASRIGITNALYDYFAKSGAFPEVLISGSAIGFYGDAGDRLLTEGAICGTGFAAELCSDWEAAANKFSPNGTRVCLLRTGVVLGNGGMLAKTLPAFRLGGGGILGNGKQWMSWIQLDDLVRLIVHCLNTQLVGPVNGVAPQPITNKEFTRALGDLMRRPTFMTMPSRLLSILFGEMAGELLLISQRVIPQVAQQNGFVFQYPELRSALCASLVK